VLAQLISLWAEHVSEQSEQLLEDAGAPLDSGVGKGLWELSGSICNRAPTQPDSPRANSGAA
jgi:hypothetical protein